MSRALNLEGKRFGRLSVISRTKNDSRNNTQWICCCDCGRVTIVRGSHLTSGNTRSCGCLDIEAISKNNFKHGMWNTRIYNIWKKMKDRCYNPNSPNYKYYGAKGVKVCDEWQDFSGFYRWVQTTNYNDKLTIDRINCFGNYEPSNFRWATMKEQNNNTSKNFLITIGTETKSAQEWSEASGLHRTTILARIKNGWSAEEAVLTPKYQPRGSVHHPSINYCS